MTEERHEVINEATIQRLLEVAGVETALRTVKDRISDLRTVAHMSILAVNRDLIEALGEIIEEDPDILDSLLDSNEDGVEEWFKDNEPDWFTEMMIERMDERLEEAANAFDEAASCFGHTLRSGNF